MMTKKLLTILAAVAMLFAMNSCNTASTVQSSAESSAQTSAETSAPATHTVTFDLNGGELVSGEAVQSVADGDSAVAPEVKNGNLALTWSGEYANITSDITVTAQWSKVAMNTTDLASYVQARTVTVNVTTITGDSVVGSGFFIDDQGTIVTNYHVIDSATAISVQVSDGGSFDVKSIIDFSEVYDLAILKIDMTGNNYLDICNDKINAGEKVYAVGSALGTLTGTFTGGMISSVSRTVGLIDCIQTDSAISSGNSGGPLVNEYGEIVGINAFSYINGENLNLAIKMSTLDKLSRNKNYTINDYKEWYITEVSRSFSPMDENGNFYYSTVNTYQIVTGATCLYSVDSDDNLYDGYSDMYNHYIYDYVVSQYDAYVTYLKSIGFVYQDYETFDNGTSYYYLNEKDGVLVDLFVTSDNANLCIWVSE
jgi:Trypsin-like serine proteases, typically periplasmic, contain C-terminal PDZ domain